MSGDLQVYLGIGCRGEHGAVVGAASHAVAEAKQLSGSDLVKC